MFTFQALRLNNSSRKGSTLGEITNLMAVDAQKFVDVSTQLNLVWSAPFQMCVAIYFLWQTLGPSVIAGVVVMVLLIPINAFIAKKSRNFQVCKGCIQWREQLGLSGIHRVMRT